jgi:hypothetical protein
MAKTGCSWRGIDGFGNERSKNDVYAHEHKSGEDVIETVLKIDFLYGLEYGNLVSIKDS